MKLKAGELSQLFTLQKRSNAVDAIGDLKRDVWTEVGKYHCKLTPVNARNVTIAKGIAPTATYILLTWYRPIINDNFRVVCKGKIYNIESVLHNPEDDWTQVFLVAVEE